MSLGMAAGWLARRTDGYTRRGMAGRRQARIAPLVTVLGLAAAGPPAADAAPVDRGAVRNWRDVAGITRAPALARREVVVVLRAAPAALRPGALASRKAF